MNSRINYSFNNHLENQIRYRKFIPYTVYPNDKYKRKQWYYSSYDNQIFKILEVKYSQDGQLEYAYIRSVDKLYSLIVSDLSNEDYLLEKDSNNIYKKNIINSTTPYTGAEIFYWFFMNNITSFDKKYKNFWRFVDRNSCSRLSELSKYFLTADKDKDGNYINCKIMKVKNISPESEEDRENYNEYMRIKKEKDLKKVKKIHEKELS